MSRPSKMWPISSPPAVRRGPSMRELQLDQLAHVVQDRAGDDERLGKGRLHVRVIGRVFLRQEDGVPRHGKDMFQKSARVGVVIFPGGRPPLDRVGMLLENSDNQPPQRFGLDLGLGRS